MAKNKNKKKDKPKAKKAVKKSKPVAKKTVKKIASKKPIVKKVVAKKEKPTPKKVKKTAKPLAKKAVKKIASKKPVVKKVVAKKEKTAPKPIAKKAEVKAQVKTAKAPEVAKAKAAPAKTPYKPVAKQFSEPINLSAIPDYKPEPPAIQKRDVVRPAKSNQKEDNRNRYSEKELGEFKKIILEKLEQAKKDYELLKNTLCHTDDHGTDDTSPTFKMLEDGSDVLTREETAQLALRQEKFIQNLQNALIRIENKTYGICRATGKLIPKERLKRVPHATLSIDAKLEQQYNA
jgi:RNA polymerase-binding transcription factor DksA